MPENSISLPVDSIFYNRNCKYGIEAIEHTVVNVFNYSEFEKIVLLSPKLEAFSCLLLIHFIKMITDKLYAIQFQSANERYQSMLENYPDILQKVPLSYIASFLGITQETVSHIRGGK